MDKSTTYLHLVIELAFRACLWIAYLYIDTVSPYVRHIDEDELWYYRYPSIDSFIPKHALHGILVVAPLLVFMFAYICYGDDKHTVPSIVNHLYGISLAYCINGLFTATLKIALGRPRPNFYLRCFPEGYGTDIDNCDGEYHGQMDGRKSFPSAHASFIFACMVYLCLYLNQLLQLTKPRLLKGVIITFVSFMMLIALVVAISRTCDYHHHYSDVLGGAIMGSTFAAIFFHLYNSREDELDDSIRQILKLA